MWVFLVFWLICNETRTGYNLKVITFAPRWKMVDETKPPSTFVINNLIRFLGFLLIFALLLFGSAGTFAYWQVWTFLIAFGLAVAIFMLYGIRRDPNLLLERSRKARNVKHWDAVILNIYTVFLVSLMILAPLDGGRFHWSKVPLWVNRWDWV